MPELRKDPVVGRWTLVEVQKSKSASDYPVGNNNAKRPDICAFCPGRESFTPGEIASYRPKESKANTPGWMVRTIPNKFPALEEGDLEKEGMGIYDVMSGVGAHEVLIETPDHDRQLADLSLDEMVVVLKQYHQRFVSLSHDKRSKYVMVFKNFGASAGASVEHAHGQIIALPMIPKYVLEEIRGGEHYHAHHGSCIFCDMIAQEYKDRERIVVEENDFIAFCPFAPRYAFETWIMPKAHAYDFGASSEESIKGLAKVLLDVLKRFKKALGNPAYNFYLHTSPNGWGDLAYFHWHIEVIPKLTRSAGFEWGTGLHVVPTDPAMAANQLRQANY